MVTSKQIAVERNLNFKGRLCSGRFKLFFFFYLSTYANPSSNWDCANVDYTG